GGALLGAGARRVRGDDHVRGQLPGAHPDHAARRLPRAGDRAGGRDRAQPGAARRIGGDPRRAAGPVGERAVTLHCRLVVERPRFRLDVTLTVAAGEVVALLGPNGAGKTTALRALAGLTPLTAGHIELDGRPLHDLPAEARPI